MIEDPILSLVVPCFNEECSIGSFLGRVEPVMEGLDKPFEIVCVDDGSTDSTFEKLLAHRSRNHAIKVIRLSRNFGKEAALTAGFDYARGRAVVPIDCDLQDPPEVIPDLVEKWGEGYDVVYATRESRQSDDFMKRLTASGYYKVFNLLSDVSIPYDAGDFRILDQRVVDAVRALPERKRFNKGLFAWVGFRQTGIGYHREQRTTGSSKWRPWRLWNFAMDGIFSFSTWPLRIWSYIGFGLSLLAIIYAGFLIARTLVQGIDVPGYASTLVVILFLGGIQLISLGIFGEYLGRIFEEVKQRPLYLVSAVHGIDEAPPPGTHSPQPEESAG